MKQLKSKLTSSRSQGTYSTIMQALSQKPSEEDADRTQAEIICQKLIDMAKKGDIRAAEVVMDRTDGKVGTQIDPALAIQLVRSMSMEEYALHSGVPLRELQRQQAAYANAQLTEGDNDESTREDTGYTGVSGGDNDQAELAGGLRAGVPDNDEPSPAGEAAIGGDDGSGDPDIPF